MDNSGNGYGPWIGGYRKGKSWQWLTGETFKYSNWSTGEPNNYNGKEDVICFYRAGMIDKPFWNDVNGKTILPACIVEFD